MDEQERLQRDPLSFRHFTCGPCRWFTGSGWRTGQITAVSGDRVAVQTAPPGARSVVIFDARNVAQ
jgi:hypothetical protein